METKHFRLYLKILIPIVFLLISLGGAVRAMNAGLACPDWPLCFGEVIPDFQLQVYYEFIHRAIAGIVGLLTLGLTILIFINKCPRPFKRVILIADGILLLQIILGGLTVLHLLRFEVVTLHLIFGVSFLGALLWLYFMFSEDQIKSRLPNTPRSLNVVLGIVLIFVLAQIGLGGLVSSNYAGLACGVEFPTCLGEFLPQSGVAAVHLHAIHRIWGYLTAMAIFALFRVFWLNRKSSWMAPEYLKMAGTLLILIILQIGVGAANVLFKVPPLITVVHLFLATLIMAIILRIFFLGTHFAKNKP